MVKEQDKTPEVRTLHLKIQQGRAEKIVMKKAHSY